VLARDLPEYGEQQDQHEVSGLLKLDAEPEMLGHARSWIGRQLRDPDHNRIGVFQRDKFLFSQLEKYPDWKVFAEEALRLWDIHVGIAQPEEVQRIGVRFINRIPIPEPQIELEQYIHTSPKPPNGLDMPFSSFLYQDSYTVPDAPYGITITRTAEPTDNLDSPGFNLIIDIDVFTKTVIKPTHEKLAKALNDMRDLKNRAFFGTITDKTKELLA
jgi:uncharacterized protein (TIGR04255 family)